ncbi:MAG: hypothetical protein ACI81I_000281, partial [Arcobacteraceae bacterium]
GQNIISGKNLLTSSLIELSSKAYCTLTICPSSLS